MTNTIKFKGIRIYNGITSNINSNGTPIFVHGSLDQSYSDFYTFFNSLFKDEHCYWAFQNTPDFWSFPDDCFILDDEDEESFKKLSYKLYNTGYIYRNPEDGKNLNGYSYEGELHMEYNYTGIFTPDYMKSYSKYIKNDWNQIVVIDKNVYNSRINNNINRFLNYDIRLSMQEEMTFLEDYVRWYFYNFDGLFWSFYSKNIDDIRNVKDELSIFSTIKIEDDSELKLNELKLEFMNVSPSSPKNEDIKIFLEDFNIGVDEIENELKKDEEKNEKGKD